MDTTVYKHCLILLLYSVMSTTSAYLLVGCGVCSLPSGGYGHLVV